MGASHSVSQVRHVQYRIICYKHITCPIPTYSGGRVVHSEGRLIPHQFPITDLQQIKYNPMRDKTGYGITCYDSSRWAWPKFMFADKNQGNGEVSQSNNEQLAILHVDATNIDTFQNKDVYCDSRRTNYFYLYLRSSNSSE